MCWVVWGYRWGVHGELIVAGGRRPKDCYRDRPGMWLSIYVRLRLPTDTDVRRKRLGLREYKNNQKKDSSDRGCWCSICCMPPLDVQECQEHPGSENSPWCLLTLGLYFLRGTTIICWVSWCWAHPTGGASGPRWSEPDYTFLMLTLSLRIYQLLFHTLIFIVSGSNMGIKAVPSQLRCSAYV